jgi:hypothetical protein
MNGEAGKLGDGDVAAIGYDSGFEVFDREREDSVRFVV